MRRNAFPLVLAIAASLWSGVASAGAIQLTGFVEKDFPAGSPSVTVLPHSNDPFHLGQATWMTQRGWVNGWSIKDVRLSYDAKTDTMFVGVNTFSVAGNVDGNGTPGIPDPLLTKAGGIDPANFGGDKSISVAFAPPNSKSATQPGSPVIVAGVSADKSTAGPGTDGFTVAAYKETGNGIEYDYGKTLTDHLGNLAFDPSLAHPGFEFTITNFSKGLGLDPSKPLWISVYAGSIQGIVAGKDFVPWSRVPAPEFVPEPTTILAWASVLGIVAWRMRRRLSA
jgi:hypothetical protein